MGLLDAFPRTGNNGESPAPVSVQMRPPDGPRPAPAHGPGRRSRAGRLDGDPEKEEAGRARDGLTESASELSLIVTDDVDSESYVSLSNRVRRLELADTTCQGRHKGSATASATAAANGPMYQ
ncbi:hypothetical protein FDECE_11884 [Fusarium decemcellulare]|nr:hypothetical protein FDECE_11884 [Fusarium decemcellulare]